MQAHLMDKISVVRSVTHTNPGHGMGSHWMLTGYVPTIEINDNLNPCAGSVVGADARRKSAADAGLCLRAERAGAFRCGVPRGRLQCVHAGKRSERHELRVRDLRLAPNIDLTRFRNRRDLLQGVDTLRRDVDREGNLEGYDRFYRDAFEIVTSTQCRDAFDMRREDRVCARSMAGTPGAKVPCSRVASSRPASPTSL